MGEKKFTGGLFDNLDNNSTAGLGSVLSRPQVVGRPQSVGDRPNSPMLERWVSEGLEGLDRGGVGNGGRMGEGSLSMEDDGLEGEDGEVRANSARSGYL